MLIYRRGAEIAEGAQRIAEGLVKPLRCLGAERDFFRSQIGEVERGNS
jgi:hypothetical protein